MTDANTHLRRVLARQRGEQLATETLARIARALDRQNARGTWARIEPPLCDICFKIARWSHPTGGLRCNTCPRPT